MARRQITTRPRSLKVAATAGVLAFASSVGAACSGGGLEANPDGPGASVISSIIACKDDGDCKSGEACGSGFCQMKRCSATSYTSLPPLGAFGYAYLDRAFVASGSDTTIQALSSQGKEAKTPSPSAAPLDIAGGNLTGERPESLAYVSSGSHSVSVVKVGGEAKPIDLGWQGKRIATGDLNGDGIDEIVVASEGTDYAVCDAVNGTCSQGTVSQPADDVAIGDVDGDGYGEILFVGNHTLTIVNANAKTTGEALTTSHPLTPTLANITAGDVDGDGTAEIIGNDVGGWTTNGRLYVFKAGEGGIAELTNFDLGYIHGTVDVAYTKQDNQPAIGLLTKEGSLKLFSYAKKALTKTAEKPFSGSSATRLAAADVGGRSASVRLKTSKPALEIGPPVPIAVLALPPYSAAHSAGPSSATIGTTEESSTADSHGTSHTSSVSLSLGGGFGFPSGGRPLSVPGPNGAPVEVGGAKSSEGTEKGLPSGGSIGIPGLSASLSVFFNQTWSRTVSHSVSVGKTTSIGGSYTVTAEPQVDGYNSGGVVLAGGCFHRYDYTVDDPQKRLETPSAELTTFVPVGGETSLWSSARYNALVDAIANGKLPKVKIASKLGSVSSYSSSPMTLDGKPIARADNVFPKSPVFRASDVGTVSFSLTASDNTTNTDATAFSYGSSVNLSANVNVGPIHANAQGTKDWNDALDQSYSVTVGTSASFSGQVSPVRDDPSTPGNEADTYAYSFQPIVYRQHFTDTKGQDGAFYVLTYAVGP